MDNYSVKYYPDTGVRCYGPDTMWTDGRTDGQVDSNLPPNFVCGEYKYLLSSIMFVVGVFTSTKLAYRTPVKVKLPFADVTSRTRVSVQLAKNWLEHPHGERTIPFSIPSGPIFIHPPPQIGFGGI